MSTASSNLTSYSANQTSNIHRRKSQETRKTPVPTDMHHIVFGIAASVKLQRHLPVPVHQQVGPPFRLRISRIVSETLRLGLKNVRWFVMGEDDTVFITENLVRILHKYDHNQYYYIGSLSESHLQNIFFSFGMAYGGGGFAISYPLL